MTQDDNTRNKLILYARVINFMLILNFFKIYFVFSIIFNIFALLGMNYRIFHELFESNVIFII